MEGKVVANNYFSTDDKPKLSPPARSMTSVLISRMEGDMPCDTLPSRMCHLPYRTGRLATGQPRAAT